MPKAGWHLIVLLVASLPVTTTSACSGRDIGSATVDWSTFGGNKLSQSYSNLEQISKSNVNKLDVEWRWRTPDRYAGSAPLQVRPIVSADRMYLVSGLNVVASLDATTGDEGWRFDPMAARNYGQIVGPPGWVHRGVAIWHEPNTGKPYILLNSRARLMRIDAESGQIDRRFGSDGTVALEHGVRRGGTKWNILSTSPPVVWKNIVVVGSSIQDQTIGRRSTTGDVQAFDIETGKRLWTFSTVAVGQTTGLQDPQDDVPGHTNVWAPMAVDEKRGLLYLPVSTPTNDHYGGNRPGSNRYADSIVCLDIRSGIHRWDFQFVHHGLWDYDTAAQPILVDLRVGTSVVPIVVQCTKMGWIYVFNRVTGESIWPVEEVQVPSSDVPGEQTWETQPRPSRPPAVSRQGIGIEDLADWTPNIAREAAALLSSYESGPMFTPPAVKGTVVLPGIFGGVNWGGGAVDPDRQVLVVKTTNWPSLFKVRRVEKGDPRHRSDEDVFVHSGSREITLSDGLPLIRPPYGELVAIDLKSGSIVWRAPAGDWPELRKHARLLGVALPSRLGNPGRPGPLITKGGLVFVGGGDEALSAFDIDTGKELWRFPLAKPTTGSPMTYSGRDGVQRIAVATGRGVQGELLVFAVKED